MAYPADPEPGYGWEKLFAEELCKYHAQDFGLKVRIARFHNVYGPQGTYDGGREKAPAAICRKIAMASTGGEVHLWGNGQQRRSFLSVDDCVEGLLRLMRSEIEQPINLGSELAVPIEELASLIMEISGKSVRIVWEPDKPSGVGYRNSDSLLARVMLGWEPRVSLKAGLTTTYWWIVGQLKREGRYAPIG
jgi:nucleoside-diphosphate-sugar epimerase